MIWHAGVASSLTPSAAPRRPLAQMPSLSKVTEGALFKSEPNPAWFGNPANLKAAGWDQPNWLTSRFHFSFAEWSAGRSQLGVLRVLNDDRVQPKRGFGTHGHANMEIVTYIVEGTLTHQDSMGSAESLGRGAIQYMTAGTGVRHSEHNLSPDEPLRFIQVRRARPRGVEWRVVLERTRSSAHTRIVPCPRACVQMWIVPRARGLKPNYGSATSTPEERRNQWAHLVSDVADKASATGCKINQDASVYASELDAQRSVPFAVEAGRQVYLVCLEGAITLVGADGRSERLQRHEAAEASGPQELRVSTLEAGAHCLLVEMAAS